MLKVQNLGVDPLMKILEAMVEVLEEYETYKYILILTKSIYGLIQSVRFWFKEYIKTTTLKVVFR